MVEIWQPTQIERRPYRALILVGAGSATAAGGVTGRAGPQVYRLLRDYRQRMGIDAELVAMAMVPTEFTVADPNDSGMLDVSGFATNTPRVVADFAAGRV